MKFATPADAIVALFAAFGPKDDPDWRVGAAAFAPVREAPGSPSHLKRFHGALLRTLHFGLVTIDFDAATVEFVDEDHRDGGDSLRARAPLPPDWVTALRAVAWPA